MNSKNYFLLSTFAFMQIIVVIYYIYYSLEYGYLPSPFINDKSNSFMDLYNTMCWSSRGEYYSIWSSVYPPINFLLLQMLQGVFSLDVCSGSAEVYRADYIWLMSMYFLMVFLLPFFIIRASGNYNISPDKYTIQKILLYVIIILSPSVLFTLERGNLIFLSVLVLVYLLSVKSEKHKVLLIALLINLKPYFLLLSIYYLARRDFKNFFRVVTFSGLIFIVTGALLEENYWLFFYNIIGFSGHESLFSNREVLSFPSSVSSFSYVLSSQDSFLTFLNISSDFVSIIIDLTKYTLLIIAVIIYLKNGKFLNVQEGFFYLIIIITNLGISVGGYSLLLYLPFLPYIFILRKDLPTYNIVLVLFMVFLNSSMLDLVNLYSQNIGAQFSFLANRMVEVDWSITLGSALRPVLNMLLFIFVIYRVIKNKNTL